MPKSKSTGKKKPSVKVKDLRAKKNPKGGETRQDGSLDADIRFKIFCADRVTPGRQRSDLMATPKKSSRKPSVKVADLHAKKNPKGGRDPASGLPTGKRMHKPLTIK